MRTKRFKTCSSSFISFFSDLSLFLSLLLTVSLSKISLSFTSPTLEMKEGMSKKKNQSILYSSVHHFLSLSLSSESHVAHLPFFLSSFLSTSFHFPPSLHLSFSFFISLSPSQTVHLPHFPSLQTRLVFSLSLSQFSPPDHSIL